MYHTLYNLRTLYTMEKPDPKSRRYEKTRQGIINAAHEIVRTEGIDALSIRTLAEKVDYSPSALYKYFNNKEEIIEALRVEGWNRMQTIFESRLDPSLDSPRKLVKASLAYLELGDQYPELYQLMFNSSVGAPDNIKAIEDDPRFKVLTDMIKEGVKSGEFVLPDDITLLEYRYLAWFIMHGICMLKVSMYRNCLNQFDPLARSIVEKFILMSAHEKSDG